MAETERSDIQFMLNRFEDENQRILGEFAELKGKATYLTLAQSPMKTRRNPAKTKKTGKMTLEITINKVLTHKKQRTVTTGTPGQKRKAIKLPSQEEDTIYHEGNLLHSLASMRIPDKIFTCPLARRDSSLSGYTTVNSSSPRDELFSLQDLSEPTYQTLDQ